MRISSSRHRLPALQLLDALRNGRNIVTADLFVVKVERSLDRLIELVHIVAGPHGAVVLASALVANMVSATDGRYRAKEGLTFPPTSLDTSPNHVLASSFLLLTSSLGTKF